MNKAIVFCSALSLSCNKEVASHRPPVPAFRLTPIRVREKRMNTYKTAKTARSYQKINKSICKKKFYNREPILLGDVLLTKSCKARQKEACNTKQIHWRRLWMLNGTI